MQSSGDNNSLVRATHFFTSKRGRPAWLCSSLISLSYRVLISRACGHLILPMLLLLIVFSSEAQLQLAHPFADHMILQRGKPIKIWGKATPGSAITIELNKITKTADAASDSSWSLLLPSQKADGIPRVMNVYSRKDTVRIVDILFGDLWVCIGQSNMEWPMKKEKYFSEINGDLNLPLLRICNPAYAGKNVFGSPFSDSVIRNLTPQKFYSGSWETSNYSSVSNMSAVAYYFGISVLEKTGVPVGLINLSIGGAPLESFISKETLASSKEFAAKVEPGWLTNPSLPVWIRERGMQNVGKAAGVPADAMGSNHAFKPGLAYEAGIAPLLPLSIAGILCYQGESNAQEWERVAEYGALSKLLVDDYRAKWQQLNLPFYFVQLSSIDSIKYKSQFWPEFRNEQRKMLASIPHSGMAVCSDIGALNDVHPTNKKWVGQRLARWALHAYYHQPVLPSGPLPIGAHYKKGKLTIRFRFSGKGLRTIDKKELKGFSIDGIHPASALIKGRNKVIIPMKRTSFVYYGWKPYSDGNLSNSEGLPASTFKIEVQ